MLNGPPPCELSAKFRECEVALKEEIHIYINKQMAGRRSKETVVVVGWGGGGEVKMTGAADSSIKAGQRKPGLEPISKR